MQTLNGEVRLQIESPHDLISRDNVRYRKSLADKAGNLEVPFKEVEHAFIWAEHGNRGVERGSLQTRPYGGVHIESIEKNGGQLVFYGVQIRFEGEIDYQESGHIVVTIYPLDHPKFSKREKRTFGEYALVGRDKIGHIYDYYPYPGYQYSLADRGIDTSDLDSKVIEELLRSLRQEFDVLGVDISAHTDTINDIFVRNGFLKYPGVPSIEGDSSSDWVGYRVLEEIE